MEEFLGSVYFKTNSKIKCDEWVQRLICTGREKERNREGKETTKRGNNSYGLFCLGKKRSKGEREKENTFTIEKQRKRERDTHTHTH